MYYVYMIKNNLGELYIGISHAPQERLSDHNKSRGAKFTKKSTGFGIVFLEEYATLDEAHKREIQIKKWRRDKKEKLIDLYKRGRPTKL